MKKRNKVKFIFAGLLLIALAGCSINGPSGENGQQKDTSNKENEQSTTDFSTTGQDSGSSNDGIFTSHINGEKMKFQQPDGSFVEVLLFGDVYFMRAESPEGYTVLFDTSSGWICYAKRSESGDRLVSSGIPYSNSDFDSRNVNAGADRLSAKGIVKNLQYSQEQINEIRLNSQQQIISPGQSRSDSTNRAPVTGTINQLAILVDFPDRRANISKAEIHNSFNASSYGDKRSSIKTWTIAMSNNMVTLNTHVIGYYTARYNTAHYKRGGTHDYSAANELKAEVLPWADANFDFSILTQNNGRVQSFNILYAGDTIANGWANSLWPHASSYNYQTNDGVRTGSYFMSNIGNSTPLNLSTTRHELGHNVFNWPDTYDYQGDSYSGGGFAMERDIPCAPFRAMHGWINVININDKNRSYDLPDDANTALRYNNPSNSNEYFMIEYVRKTGWRSNAPDEGILIWHVDEQGNNSLQDMTLAKHYRHSVEQADGLFQLEKKLKNGSDGDLFHEGFKTDFNDSTMPNSKWWNGSSSGLKVSNIGSKGGSTMRVTIGEGSADPVIALVARSNYKFVCAPDYGWEPLKAISDAPLEWEKFTLLYNNDGSVSLLSHANWRFLQASDWGWGQMGCWGEGIGSWEKFNLIYNDDGTVSLQSHANWGFVQTADWGWGPIGSWGEGIGDWEKFYLEYH